jgi:hypothetical protein
MNHDFRARLAWRGAMFAALLNAFGSPFDLAVAHNVVVMPPAPALFSSALGFLLFAYLLWNRDRPSRTVAAAAFCVNTLAIVIMLWLNNEHWVTIGPRWAPFQANKLGAITVGILTPEIGVGILNIAAYAGSAVIQWLTWDAAQRAVLARGEPVPTCIFAVFGIVLLVFCHRRYAIERRLVEEREQSKALEDQARTLLAVRDFCNTPLQTIESATALARLRHPEAAIELRRIERALLRMHQLHRILSRHETHLRWTKEDESFDAVERLSRDDDA